MTAFGIVCLTKENQHAPWINHEAGALSKSVDPATSHVATLLVDIAAPSEVTGPLAQFQATRLTLADMQRLVRTIDLATGAPRPADRVDRLVETLWPSFSSQLDPILRLPTQENVGGTVIEDDLDRTIPDVLSELLTLTRQLIRQSDVESVVQSRAGVGFTPGPPIVPERDDPAFKNYWELNDAVLRELGGPERVTKITVGDDPHASMRVRTRGGTTRAERERIRAIANDLGMTVAFVVIKPNRAAESRRP